MANKILIALGHPNLERSRISRTWLNELAKDPDHFIILDLYKEYPSFQMTQEGITRDHTLIDSADALVLQFPLYQFGAPALVKHWLDTVFNWGWAFGPGDNADAHHMRDLKVAAAVSCGCKKSDFASDGAYGFSLEEDLRGLHAFTLYGQANWCGLHTIFGTEYALTDEQVEQNAREYAAFCRAL